MYLALRQATEAHIRQVATLLAFKPYSQLRGMTEVEVRDRLHAIGARGIEMLSANAKRGTTRASV